MMMTSQVQSLLSIMVICFTARASARCKSISPDSLYTSVEGDDGKLKVEDVFNKLFKDTDYNDKCMSAKKQNFWNIASSSFLIGQDGHFTRSYYLSDGSEQYSTKGEIYYEEGKRYISWTAKGGIPGGTTTGQRSGRFYILNIEHHDAYLDGAVITYYSCFDDDDIISKNVYISQVSGGNDEDNANYFHAAHYKLTNSDLPSEFKDVKCYE